MSDFEEFPKIPRLVREMILTEKIDGSNVQLYVKDDGSIVTGSRTKPITIEDDYKGFARWVRAHAEELRTGLGFGRHYGEWWGAGIGRGYGLKEKRFSLFNTSQWNADNAPKCCSVVPVLYKGMFDTNIIDQQIDKLKQEGSVAVPGWMKPEGIVVYHVAANCFFKRLIENDDVPKGLVRD